MRTEITDQVNRCRNALAFVEQEQATPDDAYQHAIDAVERATVLRDLLDARLDDASPVKPQTSTEPEQSTGAQFRFSREDAFDLAKRRLRARGIEFGELLDRWTLCARGESDADRLDVLTFLEICTSCEFATAYVFEHDPAA